MRNMTELQKQRKEERLHNFNDLFYPFHAELINSAWEDESISDNDYSKGFVSLLYAEKADLDKFVPAEFKHLVANYENYPNPDTVRCCSHCGLHMKEGYYLAGEYACTERCAIALYNGDKAQFEDDLEQEEVHNYGEVYYTEWDSYFYE